MKILWIFVWGLHKIGLYLGVISMHLGLQGTEVGILFGAAKILNIFRVLEIPDIFWGEW